MDYIIAYKPWNLYVIVNKVLIGGLSEFFTR